MEKERRCQKIGSAASVFSLSRAQGRGLLALEPKAALLAGSLGAAAGFGSFRLDRLRAASRDAPHRFFVLVWFSTVTNQLLSPGFFWCLADACHLSHPEEQGAHRAHRQQRQRASFDVRAVTGACTLQMGAATKQGNGGSFKMET